jgi:hypothetical protein
MKSKQKKNARAIGSQKRDGREEGTRKNENMDCN